MNHIDESGMRADVFVVLFLSTRVMHSDSDDCYDVSYSLLLEELKMMFVRVLYCVTMTDVCNSNGEWCEVHRLRLL